MDVKSLAKSKRAHSQHHTPKHHHSKPKPKPTKPHPCPSSDSKTVKQTSTDQTVNRKPRPLLPSNWDRYDDEEGEDEIEQNLVSDVPLAKSKGADYKYLIAEAQSQSQFDVLSSFDDLGLGLSKEGEGSLLSIRGEGLLSWISDDNFVVDDEASSRHEASFFSLNLNALAKQLEKINLAERLFIEPDLLPPELHGEALEGTTKEESGDLKTHKDGATMSPSDELSLEGSTGGGKEDDDEVGPSSRPTASDISVNHVAIDVNGVNSIESAKPTAKTSGVVAQKQCSKFEAAAAEAELDALLGSLGETKIIDSSGSGPRVFPAGLSLQTSVPMSQSVKKIWDPPSLNSPPSVANFDDVLDDLLMETSSVTQNGVLQPQRVNTAPQVVQSSLPQVSSSSKVLDDFDSWLDTL